MGDDRRAARARQAGAPQHAGAPTSKSATPVPLAKPVGRQHRSIPMWAEAGPAFSTVGRADDQAEQKADQFARNALAERVRPNVRAARRRTRPTAKTGPPTGAGRRRRPAPPQCGRRDDGRSLRRRPGTGAHTYGARSGSGRGTVRRPRRDVRSRYRFRAWALRAGQRNWRRSAGP